MRFCVCREKGRTPARSIGAAIVTELVYGCNCRSANGNTATVRQAYFRRTVGIRGNFVTRDTHACRKPRSGAIFLRSGFPDSDLP
jgi:hypothetical protein